MARLARPSASISQSPISQAQAASPVAKAQGWVITDCYDINNLGQIAGVGERNGQRYGVLLQPVPGGALGFIPPTPAWP